MTPTEKIEVLLKVCESATPGPWNTEPGTYGIRITHQDCEYDYPSRKFTAFIGQRDKLSDSYNFWARDAKHIATFNPERMRKILEAYREMMEVITRETNARPPDQACHLCKVLSAAEEALEME